MDSVLDIADLQKCTADQQAVSLALPETGRRWIPQRCRIGGHELNPTDRAGGYWNPPVAFGNSRQNGIGVFQSARCRLDLS